MQIPYIKCHGSGNEFIMMDNTHLPGQWTPEDWGKLSRLVSDRSGVLGSDGLLVVMVPQENDGGMRMFNVDGSEAEMCGNGLRCVARRLHELAGKKEIQAQTLQGVVPCTVEPEIEGTFMVKARITPVVLEASKVPILRYGEQVIKTPIKELDNAECTALSIPNPHLISIVESIDRNQLMRWGHAVEAHPEVFPNGMNVSMVQALGPNRIHVTTNERGCGITKACGTAISSSSFVSCLLNLAEYGREIMVQTEGGVSYCLVESPEVRHVWLKGNATYTERGVLEVTEDLSQIRVSESGVQSGEIQAYLRLWEKGVKDIS